MKFNIKQIIKRTPKRIFVYSALAVILALISLLFLNYFEFYVHEFGHANAAMLDAISTRTSNLSINFTYHDYILFGKNLGLKYPQQTSATIHNNFSILYKISGVLFSVIFYALVFMSVLYIISKVKILRDNKKIEFSLFGLFLLILLYDFISNFLYGTDGFNMSCSSISLIAITGFFLFFELLFLGYFYLQIFFEYSKISGIS